MADNRKIGDLALNVVPQPASSAAFTADGVQARWSAEQVRELACNSGIGDGHPSSTGRQMVSASRLAVAFKAGWGVRCARENLHVHTPTVVEGAERLNRKWPELLATGYFGGIEVGLGTLAMMLVKQATGPGGLAFVSIVVLALPSYPQTIVDTAVKYMGQPSLVITITLSLLAGGTITLSTRMQQGTHNDVVVCMISGLLVIGLGMLHGALNAIIIFAAMLAGAGITIPDFLQWFAVVIPFNMLGGLLINTLPRLVRTYRTLIGVRTGEISLEKLEEEAVWTRRRREDP